VPHKDHDRQQLVAAALQLANGTQLLVDETAMTDGRLNDTGWGQARILANVRAHAGVRNLAALRRLLVSQSIVYDFHYSTCTFDTDYSILIVSNAKSLIGVSVNAVD
jgi:hypothetical protein